MQSFTALTPILSNPKRIVITTHHKPDGDAMGSSLGLYHYFLLKGHDVHVVTPTDYPYFLHWMPGNAEVVIFSEQQNKATELVHSADLIFCLDFNNLKRIYELGEIVAQSDAIKVMIDHHLEPEGFDQYRLWNAEACSTAELVYQFIKELGDVELINKNIASSLYTGIMTDSGSFRYPSTTANLHRIVADLIERGADNSRIHQLVYDTYTEDRLRLLGHCFTEKLEVIPQHRTAIISLSKEELKKYNVVTGDTEGIVNYALSLNNVKLAAFFVERADLIKISFRSKGEFPANEIAKKYFQGGGHHNAAGGQSIQTLQLTIEKFKNILPEFNDLLNQ